MADLGLRVLLAEQDSTKDRKCFLLRCGKEEREIFVSKPQDDTYRVKVDDKGNITEIRKVLYETKFIKASEKDFGYEPKEDPNANPVMRGIADRLIEEGVAIEKIGTLPMATGGLYRKDMRTFFLGEQTQSINSDLRLGTKYQQAGAFFCAYDPKNAVVPVDQAKGPIIYLFYIGKEKEKLGRQVLIRRRQKSLVTL